jgi:hypothetical protein
MADTRTLEQVTAALKQAKKTKADLAMAKLMLKFGDLTDEARSFIEDQYPNITLRITVLPNKTFRGRLHFQEVDYDASTELARYAVKEGIAKWKAEN